MIAAAFWEWSLWLAAVGVWVLICVLLAREVLVSGNTAYRLLCLGGLAAAVWFSSAMIVVML